MGRRCAILITVLLLYGGNTFGQLDEADTARWQLNAVAALRLNDGNVERLIITPELNFSHLQNDKQWGFSARQRYTYGTFGPFKTEDDLLSRNFIYLKPRSRFYPYIMAWFQTHARQQLAFRYQVGPGITWAVVRKTTHVLKLSGTITHERNTYRQSNLETFANANIKEYEVFRLTGRIFGNHSFSSNNVSLYYEFLFQQSVNSKDNWRIFAETGVNTRISNRFSMRSYLNIEYQTVYIEGQKPEDLILNIGLNYRTFRN